MIEDGAAITNLNRGKPNININTENSKSDINCLTNLQLVILLSIEAGSTMFELFQQRKLRILVETTRNLSMFSKIVFLVMHCKTKCRSDEKLTAKKNNSCTQTDFKSYFRKQYI